MGISLAEINHKKWLTKKHLKRKLKEAIGSTLINMKLSI